MPSPEIPAADAIYPDEFLNGHLRPYSDAELLFLSSPAEANSPLLRTATHYDIETMRYAEVLKQRGDQLDEDLMVAIEAGRFEARRQRTIMVTMAFPNLPRKRETFERSVRHMLRCLWVDPELYIKQHRGLTNPSHES